jgi:hypothetical protein
MLRFYADFKLACVFITQAYTLNTCIIPRRNDVWHFRAQTLETAAALLQGCDKKTNTGIKFPI